MAGVDITGGGGGGISLTKDIYVNTGLIGPFDSTSDVNVFLQNGSGGTIVPTSSVLVGNDLTITANIPVPSGVALVRPNPAQTISWNTYDTGWRSQNGWYNYTPPAYPAKYAQLDNTGGVVNFYKLKTALTVNGVTSTERFVDLSGVQGWAALNNLNYAVLDKLTGLMFTRSPIFIPNNGSWVSSFTNAYTNTVTINGNTYSDWYVMGINEAQLIFGMIPGTGNWVDPISSITILPSFPYTLFAEQYPAPGVTFIVPAYQPTTAAGGLYNTNNPNNSNSSVLYIHDASNLIT